MRSTTGAAFIALFIVCLTVAMLTVAANTPSANANNTADTSPARIEIKPELSHVMANGFDSINLTACVYDAAGNPVRDGTQINFTIGDAKSNSYMGGFSWGMSNGSFSQPPGSGTITGMTYDGCVTVRFGWVPPDFGGNNSTIWAYVNGTSVNSTVKIYLSSSYSAWISQVIDASGTGVGGIPVTLHIMGNKGNNPDSELFNMTQLTSNDSMSLGRFAFYQIWIDGAAYYYVDGEARIANNTTIYGRSHNLSMNRAEYQPMGLIVLDAPSQVTIASSPSATTQSSSAKPVSGFEAILAFAGLLSVAFVIARKRN